MWFRQNESATRRRKTGQAPRLTGERLRASRDYWPDNHEGSAEASRARYWALLILPALLLASRVCGAEAGPDFSKLAPVPPCPELVAAAEARQIPLEGLAPPGEAGRLNPGDSFTGLVTLCEKGGRQTQWLFHLTALAASPKELAHKPPEPLILYSGRSNKLEYASAPALVRLRTIGPFAEAGASRGRAKLQDESVCFSVNKGFLGIGLDLAAATICRAEKTDLGDAFWFGPTPPNSAVAAKARKAAESLQFTSEEERALGGVLPAMFSYAEIIEHTKGLQDIMMKVVEKPSIWSVIGHLGVTVSLIIDAEHFGREDLGPWGWSGSPCAYRFPMLLQLNRRPALIITLVVTSPRPPLLSCGGVVGMLAEKPGDRATYLTWRIISAGYGQAPAD